MKTVHVLVGGAALCGKAGPPNTWDKDHVWVSRHGLQAFTTDPLENVVLCPECAKAIAGMEA
jgi:hypothetical protein